MLPFLKPKSIGGSIIIEKRKSDGEGFDSQNEDAASDEGLSAAAEDLIRAVHAKDASGVSQALKAAFEIMDSAEESEQESE